MTGNTISGHNRAYAALLIAAICLGIAFCEWVFAYQDVAYGIVCALLLVLIIHMIIPILRLGQAFTDSAESLVLLPLYILFTSSLPWFFLNQAWLLPAVYSVILAICFWHIYRKKLSLREIGFTNARLPKYILMGTLVGILLGTVEYFIITPAASFPSFEFGYLVRDLIYMILFVGLAEELLFRGLIQRDMMKLLGWKWGLIGASLMFAVMHLTWRSIPELVFTFVAGLIFGYLYYRTRSLTVPIVAHGIANTVLVAILPYLLS